MGYIRTGLALLSVAVAGVCAAACDRPGSKPDREAPAAEVPPPAVKSAEVQLFKGGLSIEGVATVLSPDALIQLDSEIKAAEIALEFSKGQFERYKQTKSLSQQTIAVAEKQALTDETQLKLLQNRLAPAWGQGAPFSAPAARALLIRELAEGTKVLVRLDFPETPPASPRNARVLALQGGPARPVLNMWEAPSGNQSLPGTSYFALIESAPALKPGDRARLIADRDESATGTVIPSAAIVVYSGQAWCYVETGPDKYERRTVSLEHPVEDGFLVREGFPAGTHVVVKGASLLLAREAGPGDLDDDDGGAAKPKESGASSGTKPKDDDEKPAAPGAKPDQTKERDGTKPAAPTAAVEPKEDNAGKPSAAAPQGSKAKADRDDDDDAPAKSKAESDKKEGVPATLAQPGDKSGKTHGAPVRDLD